MPTAFFPITDCHVGVASPPFMRAVPGFLAMFAVVKDDIVDAVDSLHRCAGGGW